MLKMEERTNAGSNLEALQDSLNHISDLAATSKRFMETKVIEVGKNRNNRKYEREKMSKQRAIFFNN